MSALFFLSKHEKIHKHVRNAFGMTTYCPIMGCRGKKVISKLSNTKSVIKTMMILIMDSITRFQIRYNGFSAYKENKIQIIVVYTIFKEYRLC